MRNRFMILLFDTFWHVAQRLEEDYICYHVIVIIIIVLLLLFPSSFLLSLSLSLSLSSLYLFLSLSQDAEGQETTVEIDIAGEKVNMFYRDFRHVIIRHVVCIHVHVCVLVVLLLYISFL